MGDAPIPLPPTFPASRERFGLSDAMILIAAFAFGLAWLGMENRREVIGWTFYTPYSSISSNLEVAVSPFEMSIPIMGSLTLGLSLIQLRRPGLLSTPLFGKPGFLACLSASVAIVIYLARRSVVLLVEACLSSPLGSPRFPAFEPAMPDLSPGDLAYSAGVAVAATWIISRLVTPGGVQRGLIDRLGRLIGLYWMAAIVAQPLFDVVSMIVMGRRI
ncbi:hypothetical protein P12x_004776 [Tundrisphaera lichenicola]|uniref:hypothetical protein n=1 Tax=Tundrisphaera lichenicola TaxID=2029860 RepID=UPI003EB96D3A